MKPFSFKNFNKSKKSTVVDQKVDEDETSQDEVDKILDKISKSGYASLSKEEKEKLFKLSKK